MSVPTLPPLAYADWIDSKETLHLFLQIIGKIRLKAHPKLNHWWHVTLYPSARGLTTGRIPYGIGGFQVDFDMLDHRVLVSRTDGQSRQFDVPGLSVAGFHSAMFDALTSLEIAVSIKAEPFENISTTPFPEDHHHQTYDPEAVTRFCQALGAIASAFEAYRGRFCGKQTPVQLYWHSFDLVVTRFSGRPHPLEDARTQSDREAYSHEVISVGFWPGDPSFPDAAFYGYAYPEPDQLNAAPLAPPQASWGEKNGGALAILRYADVRADADPLAAIDGFLESLYQGAARKAGWPVESLAHQFAES